MTPIEAFVEGVCGPARAESAKRAFLEFLLPDRVVGMHAAKYGPADELGALIRTAVQAKISDDSTESAGVADSGFAACV